MLIYLLALLIAAGVLVLAFRAMGGAERVDAGSGDALQQRIAEWVSQECARLRGFARTASADPDLGEIAHGVRRRLSGYQQQLDRIAETPAAAPHQQLTDVIEALSWACRLVESEAWPGNPGVREAVATLYDHARDGIETIRVSTPTP